MHYLVTILAVVVVVLGFTAFFGAPYVPSRRKELGLLFSEAYKLKGQDTLVDLGAGDGVVMRAARKHGAFAVGYELSPVFYVIAKLLARGDSKQKIILGSYWNASFPAETTVVYAFSEGRDIKKIGQLVQQQADRLQKDITFITFGASLADKDASLTYRGYHIYQFAPCQ